MKTSMPKDNQKIASDYGENSWFESCSFRDKWKNQDWISTTFRYRVTLS